MLSITHCLKLLSDPTRLRILLLLDQAEVSVAELQDVLNMKQSRISTQLAQLKQADLVQVRKSGKNSLYALAYHPLPASAEAMARILDLVRASAPELAETSTDRAALALALRNRSDKARAYFDELAGKFGRTY
ncbi:MAG: metalloregulator ArsR/SmtB family transcription factor, partial [Verrucomicrobia bacterium]|nr:metalloregulator ArsR/SmtB family transcription factor [Verrucomicrobiota bacterium]